VGIWTEFSLKTFLKWGRHGKTRNKLCLSVKTVTSKILYTALKNTQGQSLALVPGFPNLKTVSLLSKVLFEFITKLSF
jgi:hypothetical protein